MARLKSAWIYVDRVKLIFLMMFFSLFFNSSISYAQLGEIRNPNPVERIQTFESVTSSKSGEIIKNGNFETANPNSLSTPLNWAVSIRDATARFTYPVTGNGGGKATRITTTRVDTAAYGGANWVFPHIQGVSSHTVYQYSNDYLSDVKTNVTVEYLHKDGHHSYEWINEPPATGPTWAHQVVNITVPTDVVSFTVTHVLNSVGSLTHDNVSLAPLPESPFSRGMVSLVYDDGLASQYINAVPMLIRAGLPATFAVITTYPAVEDPVYMTWPQIKNLKATGFEIASHTRTHASLTQVTPGQAQQEIQGSISDLAAQGIVATTLVYPYGDESPAVEQMAKTSGFIGARGSYYGLNTPISNRYAAYNVRLDATTTFAHAKQHIDQAIIDKRWVVFQLHDVKANGNELAITPALMQEIIDYINSSGIQPVTLEHGMNLMSPWKSM